METNEQLIEEVLLRLEHLSDDDILKKRESIYGLFDTMERKISSLNPDQQERFRTSKAKINNFIPDSLAKLDTFSEDMDEEEAIELCKLVAILHKYVNIMSNDELDRFQKCNENITEIVLDTYDDYLFSKVALSAKPTAKYDILYPMLDDGNKEWIERNERLVVISNLRTFVKWSMQPTIEKLDDIKEIKKEIDRLYRHISYIPDDLEAYEKAALVYEDFVKEQTPKPRTNPLDKIKNLYIFDKQKFQKPKLFRNTFIGLVGVVAVASGLTLLAKLELTTTAKNKTESAKQSTKASTKVTNAEKKKLIRKTYASTIALQAELIKMQDKCGIGEYKDGKIIGAMPIDKNVLLSLYMNLGEGQVSDEMKIALASSGVTSDQIKIDIKNYMSALRVDLLTMTGDTKQEISKTFVNKNDQKLTSTFIDSFLAYKDAKTVEDKDVKKNAFIKLSNDFLTNKDSKLYMGTIKSPVATAYILGIMNSSMDKEFGLGIEKTVYEEMTKTTELASIRSYLLDPNAPAVVDSLTATIDMEIDLITQEAKEYENQSNNQEGKDYDSDIALQLLDENGNLKQDDIKLKLPASKKEPYSVQAQDVTVMQEIVEAVTEKVGNRNFVPNPELEKEPEVVSISAEAPEIMGQGGSEAFNDNVYTPPEAVEYVPVVSEENSVEEPGLSEGFYENMTTDGLYILEEYINNNRDALANGTLSQEEFDRNILDIYENYQNGQSNNITEEPPTPGITDQEFPGNAPEETDTSKLPVVDIDGIPCYEHKEGDYTWYEPVNDVSIGEITNPTNEKEEVESKEEVTVPEATPEDTDTVNPPVVDIDGTSCYEYTDGEYTWYEPVNNDFGAGETTNTTFEEKEEVVVEVKEEVVPEATPQMTQETQPVEAIPASDISVEPQMTEEEVAYHAAWAAYTSEVNTQVDEQVDESVKTM